jgi:hypothetical protein
LNIRYHTARALAAWNRTRFANRIDKLSRQSLVATNGTNLDVYCFAGEKQFPEAVRCAESFWEYVGRPRQWIIVSDGSLSQDMARCLIEQDEHCRVISWEEYLSAATPKCFQVYAQQHPLGKKLILLWHLSRQVKCLYTDADVLFFPTAAKPIESLADETNCCFMEDYAPAFDQRVLLKSDNLFPPVNTGLLWFGNSFSWDLATVRLEQSIQDTRNFWDSDRLHFTEQTLTHLALTQANAKPFPKNRFVISVEDQFVWQQMTGTLCARHYVGPVRHKMWQFGWKQHLVHK